MKKLKLILPFATLATIPAVVMPLTACNKLNDYSDFFETIDSDTWTPYNEQLASGTKVQIQNAMNDYIDKFNNINKAFGRDIVYNLIKSWTSKSLPVHNVRIKNCYFDTYEWRLTNEISFYNTLNYHVWIKISNLPYWVEPPSDNDKKIHFSPIGMDGAILQDNSWSIEYKLNDKDKKKLDHNITLKEWQEFWGSEETGVAWYLRITPFYYWDCEIDAE